MNNSNGSMGDPENPDYDYPYYTLEPFLETITPEPYNNQISLYGWLAIIMFSIVFMIGVPGNGLVVWVAIFKMKRTVNSIWFLNLAVADILCCVSSPFGIMILALGYWPLGLFACKFIHSMLLLNMFASVLLLTVISVDRCALVLKPVWCQNNRTTTKAYLACLVVWILAFVLSIPGFIFRNTFQLKNGYEKCTYSFDSAKDHKDKVENAIAVSRFILGFVIPFVFIFACYSTMLIKVSRRFSQSTKTLKIVLIVVIGFFVCWLPYHVAGLILASNSPQSALYKSTNNVDPLIIAIAFTNSCINPIIYVLVGQEFKTKFKRSISFLLNNVLGEETSQAIDSKRTKSANDTKNTLTLL